MEFTHNEYILDIQSTTSFNNKVQNITPNNLVLFPLLSQFATNFEYYKFIYLEFFYKSKTSAATNQATANLGTVTYAVKYDATLPPFTSKNEMHNYDGAKTCRTDNHLSIIVPLTNTWRYVRTAGLSRQSIPNPSAVLADIRNEVIGTLNIATDGQPEADIPIGELWATYRIQLKKVKLFQTMGGANRGARYISTCNSAGGNTPPVGNLNLPSQTSKYWDEMSCAFDPTGNTITFDAIDGAFIHFKMNWYGWPGTTTPLGSTQQMNITMPSISGVAQKHRFQAYTHNLSTLSGNPRTAVLAGTSSVTQYSWIIPANTALALTGNENTPLRLEFVVRCSGTQRVQIRFGAATFWGNATYVEFNLMVLDRPTMFPQQETSSVLNPTWFTAS